MKKARKNKPERKERKRPQRDKMRLFVACGLSAATSSVLAEEAERMAQTKADVNWVNEDNLHITIKFLGNVEVQTVPEILNALRKVACGLSEFEAEIMGLSFFPRSLRPKTVAVGMDAAGCESFADIAERVEDELAELGFGRSRKAFRPHITLGRVKSTKGIGALSEAILMSSGEPFGIERINELVLIMSELRRSGPVYTTLGRVSF